jgi:hypothetical protein
MLESGYRARPALSPCPLSHFHQGTAWVHSAGQVVIKVIGPPPGTESALAEGASVPEHSRNSAPQTQGPQSFIKTVDLGTNWLSVIAFSCSQNQESFVQALITVCKGKELIDSSGRTRGTLFFLS